MNSADFTFDYDNRVFGNSLLLLADSLEWMQRVPENSIHAVVTDPPFGVREYSERELGSSKGVWRQPSVLDGIRRAPVPRFTDLRPEDIDSLRKFFEFFSLHVFRVLRPGGHVFLASNSYLSRIVFDAIVRGGFEFRGEIIRLVMTLRGGDRPKGAEKEFPDICSLPRGCYEPWGLFRKPFDGRVSDCLRKWGTGGLRRNRDGSQFHDVIKSERTPTRERKIAGHPSLKPQEFMRKLVWTSLPTGKGIVLDPFAGAGSTIAAAMAVGYESIGIEKRSEYFEMAKTAIPQLAVLPERG